MNVLAIDTATESCSVALAMDNQIEQLVEIAPTGHSRLVIGMVHQLLHSQGIELSELDGIAVDSGPGSFTGLRIGIGVAQGLSYASGIKVVGVSSLAALAATQDTGLVISAIDARMKQVYWSVYQCDSGTQELLPVKVSNPAVLNQSDNTTLTNSRPVTSVIGIGSGWQAYPEQMPRSFQGVDVKVLDIMYPEAIQIAGLARLMGLDALVPPMELAGRYIRNNVVN